MSRARLRAQAHLGCQRQTQGSAAAAAAAAAAAQTAAAWRGTGAAATGPGAGWTGLGAAWTGAAATGTVAAATGTEAAKTEAFAFKGQSRASVGSPSPSDSSNALALPLPLQKYYTFIFRVSDRKKIQAQQGKSCLGGCCQVSCLPFDSLLGWLLVARLGRDRDFFCIFFLHRLLRLPLRLLAQTAGEDLASLCFGVLCSIAQPAPRMQHFFKLREILVDGRPADIQVRIPQVLHHRSGKYEPSALL